MYKNYKGTALILCLRSSAFSQIRQYHHTIQRVFPIVKLPPSKIAYYFPIF